MHQSICLCKYISGYTKRYISGLMETLLENAVKLVPSIIMMHYVNLKGLNVSCQS